MTPDPCLLTPGTDSYHNSMSNPAPRTATLSRRTGETKIELTLSLDGTGTADVRTGVGFFDHMLTLLARHSLFDLRVRAEGDLEVEAHHTVEILLRLAHKTVQRGA